MDEVELRRFEPSDRDWLVQEGIVAIPKSVTKHRIEANADLYGFELTTHDIERIRALDRHERIGPTPGEFF